MSRREYTQGEREALNIIMGGVLGFIPEPDEEPTPKPKKVYKPKDPIGYDSETDTMDVENIKERPFTRVVLKFAQTHGWLVHHCNRARYCSGGSGFPDLVMVRDGELLMAELKSEYGYMSRTQLEWRDAYPHIEVWRPSMWGYIKARLERKS